MGESECHVIREFPFSEHADGESEVGSGHDTVGLDS